MGNIVLDNNLFASVSGFRADQPKAATDRLQKFPGRRPPETPDPGTILQGRPVKDGHTHWTFRPLRAIIACTVESSAKSVS